MICEIKNGVTTYRVETPEELVAMQPPQETVEEKQKRYEELVVSFIREQYSADDEMAILRKKIANIDNGEFDTYNAYAEDCKTRARALINN